MKEKTYKKNKKKRLNFYLNQANLKKNSHFKKHFKMLYFIATIVKDVSVWSMVNVYHGIQYLVYGPVRSEESKQLEELQKMIVKQDQEIQEIRDLLKNNSTLLNSPVQEKVEIIDKDTSS